jgi:hypothetical protein
MKKALVIFIFIATAVVIVNSCTENHKEPVTTSDDQNPAMNNPDQFAWKMFVEINQPAIPNKPDSSVVWETWALARLVFDDPNNVPVWEQTIKSNQELKGFDFNPIQQQKISKFFRDDFKVMFDPSEPSPRIGGLSETRFNKPVFDFIVKNNLYYQEGIETYLKDKEILDLPIAAKEIKAVWDTIKEVNKDKYHYVVQVNVKGEKIYWGLTGLHIISKDIPQWTWATWEHVDNPRLPEIEKDPLLKSVDKFGRKDGKISPELEKLFNDNKMASKWKNYILRGTQTNFATFTGVTTILANTRTENRFLYTSSCITCHARATIGSTLNFSDLPMEVQDSIKYATNPAEKLAAEHYFNSLGFVEKVLEKPDPTTGERVLMYVGNPKPEWFQTIYTSGKKDTYKQLDFMWSFSRAKRKTPYKE